MPPPVLLLPGLLEDADGFEHPIASMREVTTVTVADLTRADTIAALAAAALAQAPAGALAIAGHSMGGYVALEIARSAPERMAKLALLNTHARPDSPESTQNRERLMHLARQDFSAVIETLMPKLLTPAHLEDADITGTISEMALGVGPEAFERQERAIIGRVDSRPNLGRIRCPTLVVAAEQDQLMPLEWLRELAQGIPGARLEIVRDSGHMAPLEQPAVVARLLRAWVET
jgi:pimeloyl-ACP methyl ester carboxylesterase